MLLEFACSIYMFRWANFETKKVLFYFPSVGTAFLFYYLSDYLLSLHASSG